MNATMMNLDMESMYCERGESANLIFMLGIMASGPAQDMHGCAE